MRADYFESRPKFQQNPPQPRCHPSQWPKTTEQSLQQEAITELNAPTLREMAYTDGNKYIVHITRLNKLRTSMRAGKVLYFLTVAVFSTPRVSRRCSAIERFSTPMVRPWRVSKLLICSARSLAVIAEETVAVNPAVTKRPANNHIRPRILPALDFGYASP